MQKLSLFFGFNNYLRYSDNPLRCACVEYINTKMCWFYHSRTNRLKRCQWVLTVPRPIVRPLVNMIIEGDIQNLPVTSPMPRHVCIIHDLHNYRSPPAYLQYLFVWHPSFLLKSSGQTTQQANKYTNALSNIITSLSRVIITHNALCLDINTSWMYASVFVTPHFKYYHSRATSICYSDCT